MSETYHEKAVKFSKKHWNQEVYVLFDGGDYQITLQNEESFGIPEYSCVAEYFNGERVSWNETLLED